MVYNSKIRLQTKRDQNIPAKDGFEWYHELFCKRVMFLSQVLIDLFVELDTKDKYSYSFILQ